MAMRGSSLNNGTIDVAVDREIGSAYDNVKLVADNMGDVVTTAELVDTGLLEAVVSNAVDISKVGNISQDVVTVANNDANITTVANDLTTTDIIGAVAANILNVVKVADNETNINKVVAIDSEVVIVANNDDNVTTTANDIVNINIVAEAITSGTGSGGTTGGGQFLGSSTLGAVMFAAQTTNEDLVLLSGTNGLIIDSITVEDGGSITIEDNAVMKVV